MARGDNIEELKENLEEIKEKIARIEGNFENELYEVGRKIKERARMAEHQTKMKIQEHPLESVGIAFGAGILAGALTAALIRRK
jgi:ElaB/YqjD/DUF883 family membrane-anchored ribosome-binding protein